jgi:hypothetical protein
MNQDIKNPRDNQRDNQRELTEQEVMDIFMDRLANTISFWEMAPNETLRDRLEGVVFSTLVTIDGQSDLPKFILAPDPHHSDKDFYTNIGEPYWPENTDNTVKCNISGGLHNEFSLKMKELAIK